MGDAARGPLAIRQVDGGKGAVFGGGIGQHGEIPLKTITETEGYRSLDWEVNDCVFAYKFIIKGNILLIFAVFGNFYASASIEWIFTSSQVQPTAVCHKTFTCDG
jgi:hypothetical protein